MGRHPAVWKRASGVVILKPGKDDYTMLMAYHSMMLLSCIANVVEKAAVELLTDKTETWGLLSDRQFVCRKAHSGIDPAAIIVDRAHAAWANGHITGVRLLHIKAAFPTMANGRLVSLTNARQMDGDLIL